MEDEDRLESVRHWLGTTTRQRPFSFFRKKVREAASKPMAMPQLRMMIVHGFHRENGKHQRDGYKTRLQMIVCRSILLEMRESKRDVFYSLCQYSVENEKLHNIELNLLMPNPAGTRDSCDVKDCFHKVQIFFCGCRKRLYLSCRMKNTSTQKR